MLLPFKQEWSTIKKLIWLKTILNAQKKRQQEREQNTQKQDTKTTTGE